MDFFPLSLVLFFSVWTWFYFFRSDRRRAKLPPGPYPVPIIGNLLQLGKNPHQTLAKLAKTYGPLMSLRFGQVYAVVVTSPEIAKEVLQKNDLVFSTRTVPEAAHAHDHHKVSMFFSPVGNDWRKFRKLSKEQMFSTHRLEANQSVRQEKLQKLFDYVQKCSERGDLVNIGEAAFTTTFNLVSATLFSLEAISFDSDNVQEFREIFANTVNSLGAPNVADYFPVLKPFDPQRVKRRAEFHFGRLLEHIEDFIKERLRLRSTSPKKNDFLETLLDLMQGSDEYELSVEDIKHLLLDLFVAGTHTTANTIEWAMTELLLNPDKLSKVKEELRTINIGESKQFKESDISKLPYFQAMIKEVFRYHPPGPLLFPRIADSDVEINGYIIPKGTQIFFNVWAIGRDSSLWSNPNSFEPKRFLGKKIDFKGQDFELIPFGSGRRMCPGITLANRVINVTVATLIHNFDWKLEGGANPGYGIEEMSGLSLNGKVPLKAIPIKL